MTDKEHAALILELGSRVVGKLLDESFSEWNAGWEIEGRGMLAQALAWEKLEAELAS